MTDSEKLLNLAQWFDIPDKNSDTKFSTEVQDDLRRIAIQIPADKFESFEQAKDLVARQDGSTDGWTVEYEYALNFTSYKLQIEKACKLLVAGKDAEIERLQMKVDYCGSGSAEEKIHIQLKEIEAQKAEIERLNNCYDELDVKYNEVFDREKQHYKEIERLKATLRKCLKEANEHYTMSNDTLSEIEQLLK